MACEDLERTFSCKKIHKSRESKSSNNKEIAVSLHREAIALMCVDELPDNRRVEVDKPEDNREYESEATCAYLAGRRSCVTNLGRFHSGLWDIKITPKFYNTQTQDAIVYLIRSKAL